MAHSEYHESVKEHHVDKNDRLLRRDVKDIFRKMAKTIDIQRTLPDNQPPGPEPNLRDQIFSGEILKMMYHRQEI